MSPSGPAHLTGAIPSLHCLPTSSHSISILGTGARWLAALEERGVHPRETHSLASLHTILSTGSPLKPQSYDYVYTHIKSDVLLGSISGQGADEGLMRGLGADEAAGGILLRGPG